MVLDADENSRLEVEDDRLTAWFLAHGASPNTTCAVDLTPLSVAVQFGSISTIQAMFEHGGSIKHGQLLHHAVRRDLPDYLDVLALVLSKNPPINNVMYQDLPSYYQYRAFALGTPLHEAAKDGKLDVVKILLEMGANPLIKDSRGEIPLQRAERARRRSVIDYLQPITANATPPEQQFTEGKENWVELNHWQRIFGVENAVS